jgi:DNA modification methylase
MSWTLYEGDCLEVLRELPDNSVDAVVTDPPYGLSHEPDMEEVLHHWLAGDDYQHRGGGFMGKTWDSFVPGPAVWREVRRVVKPGGHILCFAGTRTVDLMGISLRLGGFEIRDCLQWLYGSGFPKSLDVSKAIDKMLGAERKIVGLKPYTNDGSIRGNSYNEGGYERVQLPITAPATPEAKQWEGWGTALKPANEPIVLARKPISEKTIAENVLKWGTGGLNIDGCRVGWKDERDRKNGWRASPSNDDKNEYSSFKSGSFGEQNEQGRFPANVILDEEAGRMLDEQSGISKPRKGRTGKRGGTAWHGKKGIGTPDKIGRWPSDSGGGASRFFYVAKASRSERTMGGKVENNHPTVKPIKLMRYLCRLITPPGGTVLDPFAGSGTTLLAAVQEGFSAIGIEREPEYCEIIRKRMAELQPALPLAK